MNALQRFAEKHGFDEWSPRVKKMLLDAVQEQLGDKGKAVLANRFTARYNPKGVEWSVTIRSDMTVLPDDYIVVSLEVCPPMYYNPKETHTLKVEYCNSDDRTMVGRQACVGDYDIMPLIQSCIEDMSESVPRKRKSECKLKIRVHESNDGDYKYVCTEYDINGNVVGTRRTNDIESVYAANELFTKMRDNGRKRGRLVCQVWSDKEHRYVNLW